MVTSRCSIKSGGACTEVSFSKAAGSCPRNAFHAKPTPCGCLPRLTRSPVTCAIETAFARSTSTCRIGWRPAKAPTSRAKKMLPPGLRNDSRCVTTGTSIWNISGASLAFHRSIMPSIRTRTARLSTDTCARSRRPVRSTTCASPSVPHTVSSRNGAHPMAGCYRVSRVRPWTPTTACVSTTRARSRSWGRRLGSARVYSRCIGRQATRCGSIPRNNWSTA